MPGKHFFLVALSGSVISGSDALPVLQPEQGLVNTVWVPRNIVWECPFPQDAGMKEIQYAAFPLLCFRGQRKFMLVSSYHSRGGGDTIIIATEPGVRVDSGRYHIASNRVVVTSKTVYRTFKLTPRGKSNEARTDTLWFSGQRLVYKGVEYQPYTKLSGQSINSFWALTRAK